MHWRFHWRCSHREIFRLLKTRTFEVFTLYHLIIGVCFVHWSIRHASIVRSILHARLFDLVLKVWLKHIINFWVFAWSSCIKRIVSSRIMNVKVRRINNLILEVLLPFGFHHRQYVCPWTHVIVVDLVDSWRIYRRTSHLHLPAVAILPLRNLIVFVLPCPLSWLVTGSIVAKPLCSIYLKFLSLTVFKFLLPSVSFFQKAFFSRQKRSWGGYRGFRIGAMS